MAKFELLRVRRALSNIFIKAYFIDAIDNDTVSDLFLAVSIIIFEKTTLLSFLILCSAEAVRNCQTYFAGVTNFDFESGFTASVFSFLNELNRFFSKTTFPVL